MRAAEQAKMVKEILEGSSGAQGNGGIYSRKPSTIFGSHNSLNSDPERDTGDPERVALKINHTLEGES